MRIYLYRYGSICEPDIIDSFKRIGFDIYEETIEITNKQLLPSDCLRITSDTIINGNFSFVFTINFFPWLSDLCQIAHIIYMSLIVDSPVLELYSNSLSNSYNRVFLFDQMLYNEFKPFNPNNIFHIPLATNTKRTDNIIMNASENDRVNFSSDISFIGSTYEEKCPINNALLPEFEKGYVDGLIEAQLGVYGYNFIEECLSDALAETILSYIPNHYEFPKGSRKCNKALVAQQIISVKVAEQERLRTLRKISDLFSVDIYTRSDTSSMPNIHNRGFAKSLSEMPLIFNNSKINLNITSKSIRTGLPLRIFDILGCGGFLITNYQAELPQFFDIGTDLVAYDSMDNLIELCKYYLEHDEERKIIANNGYNKVKNLHTYDIRLLQMIDMAYQKQ